MEFGQVHHIEYYVNDLEKSNHFWDWFMSVHKYKKIAEWDGGVSYEHQSGTYLCFVQVEKDFLDSKNTRQGNGLNHLAFKGGNLEQLDELEKDLVMREIKILKRDGEYLCFEDPNEFAIEVYA
jgi:catechol 2,3-dioxygenase-like lactoylglutathione lyase family enzyme